jgi:hypothetical protein
VSPGTGQSSIHNWGNRNQNGNDEQSWNCTSLAANAEDSDPYTFCSANFQANHLINHEGETWFRTIGNRGRTPSHNQGAILRVQGNQSSVNKFERKMRIRSTMKSRAIWNHHRFGYTNCVILSITGQFGKKNSLWVVCAIQRKYYAELESIGSPREKKTYDLTCILHHSEDERIGRENIGTTRDPVHLLKTLSE